MLHRNLTALRVARTIGKKESIKVQTIEVIVPRNPDNLDSTFEEATDDVCLYAAIDEDDARNLSPLSNEGERLAIIRKLRASLVLSVTGSEEVNGLTECQAVLSDQSRNPLLRTGQVGGGSFWLVGDHILATHLLDPVCGAVVFGFRRLRFCLSPFYHYSSPHHSVFAKDLCQAAGVNTCDGRNAFARQPVAERFFGIPM